MSLLRTEDSRSSWRVWRRQPDLPVVPTNDGNPLQSHDEDENFSPPINDCSWAEVLNSMEAASGEYKAKADGHRLRAAQRNKAIAMTLQSLSGMIPEENGLSVLRGGLNTVFKLLRKRIENGERILNAFEDIPITFSEACHAAMAYPDDGLLRRYVEELYLTLHDVIPKLIGILLRKHSGSLPRRAFKQHPENEAHVIDTSLDVVSRAARRVTMRVSTLASQVMVETLRETRTVSGEVSKTQSGVDKLLDGVESIQQNQNEMEKRYSARYEELEQKTHAFVESINQNLQQRLTDYEEQFRLGFLGIQDSLQDAMRYYANSPRLLPATCAGSSPCELAQCSPSHPLLLPSSPLVSISYDDLYMLLHIPDPFFLATDLGIVLRASNNLGQTALGRATWLLNIDRFQSWARVTGTAPDMILVDGHLGGLTAGKISPLSVLTAIFASMRRSPHFTTLTHYCGLHASPHDPIAGPRGMLRSLIAQLILVQRDEHMASTVTLDEALLTDFANHDLGALCALFRALISQTRPDRTVYCVLDNVSEFETLEGNWEDELCHVVHVLQSIITDQMRYGEGPVLKVLLTAPNKSIKVYRQMASEDCISLSAGHANSHATQRFSMEMDWHRVMEF